MNKDDAGNVSQTVHAPQMLEALVCPLTRAPLKYNAETQELISAISLVWVLHVLRGILDISRKCFDMFSYVAMFVAMFFAAVFFVCTLLRHLILECTQIVRYTQELSQQWVNRSSQSHGL